MEAEIREEPKMVLEIVKNQISHLEMDYYIYMAEIIEDSLLNDGREISSWQSLLEKTVTELRQYKAYLKKESTEETEDVLYCLELDTKGGVYEFLTFGMEILESRINRLERQMEAKESIGIVTDKEDITRLVKYRFKLHKLRAYLSGFEENFEADLHLLQKYMFSEGA